MELSNLKPAEGSKHSDNFKRGLTVFHAIVSARKNAMRQKIKDPSLLLNPLNIAQNSCILTYYVLKCLYDSCYV